MTSILRVSGRRHVLLQAPQPQQLLRGVQPVPRHVQQVVGWAAGRWAGQQRRVQRPQARLAVRQRVPLRLPLLQAVTTTSLQACQALVCTTSTPTNITHPQALGHDSTQACLARCQAWPPAEHLACQACLLMPRCCRVQMRPQRLHA